MGLILIFFFLTGAAAAQITLQPGTSFTVAQGTSITFTGIMRDSLIVVSGADLINHGEIWLGDSTSVYEASGSPVTGTGFEAYTIQSGVIPASPGNLGIKFNSTFNSTGFVLRRYHTSLTEGQVSAINRYYTFIPAQVPATAADITFHYDDTELNGLNENDLTLYNYENSWTNYGGTVNGITDLVQATGVDRLDTITLFDIPNVGLHEETASSDPVKIYPVPAKNRLTIISPGDGFFRIFSISGKELHAGQLNQALNLIQVDNLVPGTYLISVTTGSTVKMSKFIIQR